MAGVGSADSMFSVVRRYALLVGGMAGMAVELLADHATRPGYLILLAAMMGFSEVLDGLPWKKKAVDHA